MESTVAITALPKTKAAGKSLPLAVAELTKAGLNGLVVLTTATGFYAGATGRMDLAQFTHTILGTAILAAGAAALNQYLERDCDALMHRTASRPLPSGRFKPESVLLFGIVLAVIGLAHLALAVNLLTSIVGAFTLAGYLLVYTPLKRRTVWNTLIGAVPGALPALMGWTAARNDLSLPGWAWFGVLFFWQIPHFMAISWLYREDYRRGGFVMLSGSDAGGERVARLAVIHAIGLLAASVGMAWLGMGGPVYTAGAVVAGLFALMVALRFAWERSERRARQLFLVSIMHLPFLILLLWLDKPAAVS